MKYTLIIPHYNDTKRLDRLLRTVPVERMDVEILVIDDCSPEQCSLIALKKMWPTLHWLSTPNNSGAGAARNVGLDNARGKYLVFADSDDEFTKDAFDVFDESIKEGDELVYFLAEGKQENINMPSIRANGFNRLCREYNNKSTKMKLEKLKVGHVVPWAKVYSKEAVVKLDVRFDETRVSNDVMFNVLTAVQINNIRVILKKTYFIYRRKESLTTDLMPSTFLERVEVSARLADKLKQIGIKTRPIMLPIFFMALSYDRKTRLDVIKICLSSGMNVGFLKVFNPFSLYRFLIKITLDKYEGGRVK